MVVRASLGPTECATSSLVETNEFVEEHVPLVISIQHDNLGRLEHKELP